MGASMRSFVQSFAGSMFMHLFIPADATPLEFSVSIKNCVISSYWLNTHMQYRDFSECLFEPALALDITENQYHFSCQKPSWFSATKGSSRPISTQALVTLAMNTEFRMDQERYRRHRKRLRQSQKIVWQALIARLHSNVTLTPYSGRIRGRSISHDF